jgi:hypothetical protein
VEGAAFSGIVMLPEDLYAFRGGASWSIRRRG